MRRLFFLAAVPALLDGCVALWLAMSGPQTAPPAQSQPLHAYVVFFDWGGVELSANSRRTLAAAALGLERARRVRTELLRDGVTPADISVAGPGLARSAPRRLQLVLQWTS